jgi:Rha family phage regulatory protein
MNRKYDEAEIKNASKELPGQVSTNSEAQANFNIPTKAELLSSELVAMDKSHKSVTANTLRIAEHFGKRPSEVNRRIINFIKRGLCKIAPSYYLNEQGKKQVYYELNRQQFAQLVLGFTGNKAEEFRLQYTLAFEKKVSELLEWRGGRKAVSESTKLANDSVHKLQRKLKEQYSESRKSGLLFIHLHNAINKAVTGCSSINRDLLELETFARLPHNSAKSEFRRFLKLISRFGPV